MTLRKIHSAFLCLLLSHVVNGQGSCLSGLQNVTTCIASNAAACATCNSTDIFSGGFTPSCAALGSALCSLSTCCSVCGDVVSSVTQECSADQLFQSCDFSCSTEPTPAPAPVAPTAPSAASTPTPAAASPTTRCDSEINAAKRCVARNILTCFRCQDELTNATNSISSIRSCGDARSQFCPVLDCCSNCADEAQSLFQCEVYNVSLLTDCALTCASTTNTTNTTSAAVTTLSSNSRLSFVAISMVAILSVFGFA